LRVAKSANRDPDASSTADRLLGRFCVALIVVDQRDAILTYFIPQFEGGF